MVAHKRKTIALFVVILLAVFCDAALAGPVAEANLVAWWKLDEDVTDSAGSNNGTPYGGTWTAGMIGSALDFDGVDDRVEIPDDDSLTPSDKITIAFWMYNRGGKDAGIFKTAACPGEPASPGNSRAYNLRIKSDTSKVRFTIRSSVNVYDNIDSDNTVGVNSWHHIAATFDQGQANIYVDGVPDGSKTLSVSSIMNDAQPLIFGGNWNYCDEDNFVQKLNGILDDVRIYDRALSDSEIQAIYASVKGSYKAYDPNPTNGATGVDPNIVLTWRPGKYADSHDVYLGTDFNDVNDANTSSTEYMGNFDVNSYDPCGLDIDNTYYWRIDEVNETEPNLWKGDTWSFTTVAPVIELSTYSMIFRSQEGLVPESRTLGISGDGSCILNWTASTDSNWLELDPDSGSSAGEVDDVNITVDINGLSPQIYTGQLTVSDPNADNNPQIVAITFIYGVNVITVPGDFNTIQAAIDYAADGVEIIIAPGTYTGNGNRDLDLLGKAITVRSIDPNDPNIVANTVINCQYQLNHRGFYLHSGEEPNTIIAGLTIKKGRIRGNPGVGGGIYCSGASPTIKNCTIYDNGAYGEDDKNPGRDAYGGGVYCTSGSSPVISGCTISGNNAWAGDGKDFYEAPGGKACGGGIYSDAGCKPAIKNCVIKNNNAFGGYGGSGYPNAGGDAGGGAIYFNSDGNLMIEDCVILNNKASGGTGGQCFGNTWSGDGGQAYGGGLCCISDCNLVIVDCNIVGNTALGGKGGDGIGDGVFGGHGGDGNKAYGGGIYNNSNGDLLIVDCTFFDNQSKGGGGGYGECSMIDGNPGIGGSGDDAFGAGIYNDSSTGSVTIENVLFSNNIVSGGKPGSGGCGGSGGSAGDARGGGIFANSNTTVKNCSIVDCNAVPGNSSATAAGGGIRGDSSTVIIDCIVWGNGDDLLNCSATYSCIEDADGCGTNGNICTDPCFVTSPFGGDYYLSWIAAGQAVDSPCVDTGSDTAANLGLDALTTRTDHITDSGIVDMGYHYFVSSSDIPLIKLVPSWLDFQAYQYGSNPPPQTVTITNIGQGPLNWTAAVDANWLGVAPDFGTCPDYNDTNIITVDVNILGLTPGIYHANVIFSDPCAGNNPKTVSVTLDIDTEMMIGLSSTLFTFNASLNEPNLLVQTLGIFNDGTGTLEWSISYDCNWLDVVPASGSSTGEVDDVNLIVDVNGLVGGYYRCDLTVEDPDAANSPQTVVVILKITSTIKVPSNFGTIQEAIDAASDGDTILIADGNYTGTGNKNLDPCGLAITIVSENGPGNCIIDCQNSGRGFYIHSEEDENCIIRGLTIKQGRIYGNPAKGGGIYCDGTSPTIIDCIITDNECYGDDAGAGSDEPGKPAHGGGICSDSGTPKIIDCNICYNLAKGGKGMDTTGIGQWATDGGDSYGGGLKGTFLIQSSLITHNKAFGGDKGLNADSGAFSGTSGSAHGGGLYGNSTIVDSDITYNEAETGGGDPVAGINGNTYGGGVRGTLSIQNCRISYNQVIGAMFFEGNYGGGAYLNSGSEMTNCLITHNAIMNSAPESFRGAAVAGDGLVSNCTIAHHQTGYMDFVVYGGTYINSVIWHNNGQGFGDSPSVTYCCTEVVKSGAGNIHTDPCFVSGPDGDYYLSQIAAGQPVDSPCVDAGSDSAANMGMNQYTTRTDHVDDSGTVDMGYHYYDINTPVLNVSPQLLSFDGIAEGPDITPQNITITNFGFAPLNWTAVADANWLVLAPDSGTCPGFYDTNLITVDVNISGLSAGKHYANLTIQAPNAVGSPQTVVVELDLIACNIADFDKNFRVDFNDFSILASQWLSPPAVPSADIAPPGGDGFVDYNDLGVFCYNWLGITRVPNEPNIPDLVSRWRFDEVQGDIAYDSTGSNHGDVIGAAWTTGIIGGALDFDGIDDYVLVNDDDSLDFGSGESFSFCMWLRFSTSDGGRFMKYSGTSENGYAIFVNSAGTAGRISFHAWSAGAVVKPGYAGGYNDSQWHFVCGVRDQSEGMMRLYVDGSLKDELPESSRDLTNSGDITIGCGNLLTNFFEGQMDDVRIYNRALTDDEVELLFLMGN